MIVDYIDSHRERFGVEPVCAVLAEAGIQIAPSTYYARRKAPLTEAELAGVYLANQLWSLWQANWGVYGARKLWHAARRAGLVVGRDQVARLMRIAGVTGTIRGRHRTVTTRRGDAARRTPTWSSVAGRPRPAALLMQSASPDAPRTEAHCSLAGCVRGCERQECATHARPRLSRDDVGCVLRTLR